MGSLTVNVIGEVSGQQWAISSHIWGQSEATRQFSATEDRGVFWGLPTPVLFKGQLYLE